MEVMNCRKCGRMYQHSGGPPICPSCKKAMEEKFTEVKKYIRENPQAGIQQISEDIDVPVNQINMWIREERLSFSKDSAVTLECEKCGASILTGRFCNNCKSTMINKMEDTLPKKEKEQIKRKKEEARMRFLDKR